MARKAIIVCNQTIKSTLKQCETMYYRYNMKIIHKAMQEKDLFKRLNITLQKKNATKAEKCKVENGRQYCIAPPPPQKKKNTTTTNNKTKQNNNNKNKIHVNVWNLHWLNGDYRTMQVNHTLSRFLIFAAINSYKNYFCKEIYKLLHSEALCAWKLPGSCVMHRNLCQWYTKHIEPKEAS